MTLPLPERPSRLVYFGTPEVAVAPLEALLDAGHDVALVVTRADKRRRRRGEAEPSPVKAAAAGRGVPATSEVDAALEVGADLGVVVAFGRLIKPHVLAALPLVNVHFSLLPRWRGAAPVERALLAGDPVTGVCLMDVVEALDEGDVFACAELGIGPTDTADDLRAGLTRLAIDLLLEGLADGFGPPRPQVGEATYAEKLTREELELDWRQPSPVLDRVVRVGGAWTTVDGSILKVWRAQPREEAGAAMSDEHGALRGTAVRCGEGWLELLEVQPEGGRRMPAIDWRRGHPLPDGTRLGR